MNAKRDLARFPEQAIKAGQINALGLIDEILHYVVGQYRQQMSPNVMAQALAALDTQLGREAVDAALRRFADEFPALAVYRREITLDAYLNGQTGDVPNRQIILEEMLMLWVANMNPACAPFMELFDDTALEKETTYLRVVAGLREFFDTQPVFGPDNQNLIDMLRSPAVAVPHSLPGQLEYIQARWGLLLGRYLYRLLGSLDLIREEEKPIFAGFGPGEKGVPVYVFAGLEIEAERFTPDREWMPRLVLIAKNAYVWLDQLSRRYQRPIARLDQIPDEELDTLARCGITGLWLIGVWERSPASQRIKQLMGNADAVASAYSLYAYSVANDLGGDAALQNLKERAWRRGIRLASDMVPNHMGIDSPWVAEHPDWFISSDASPFPSYAFDSPNLSSDERMGIYLEDHYYSRSDAAVVFKRVDHANGSVKYIYHGNDGTSLPWNDTAQLNYLKPEVREAVIQTILHVARQFPIIRFDAAMTLAKKHYQRLWFPEPGTGGAIPSRADFGLPRRQFEAAMPVEFWREVVDRAAVEAPDTLLLAEAFWLMEGYFVRTLGMHRVYNSAFMNMLRDEDNAKYRSVIKNTIEFDPAILKRYVNFMNNPDERTAVDQFGKSDKYFGVCVMLATMPGLPMFGHGQIEGLAEKYGMEFRRALWDEQPDSGFVQHHERLIFPLLHRRYLFADVENFLLYDLFTPEGHVDEDVFAYSNRPSGIAGQAERALVVYHNKFGSTRGWIRMSAAYAVKTGEGGDRVLAQRTLAEGLDIRDEAGLYTIFRDHVTGLEYLRSNHDLAESGLYIELGAYEHHVFLDFREVRDDEWRQYAQLHAYLGGRGVPSVDEAMRELFLQPIHRAFADLVNAEAFEWMKTLAPERPEADEIERKVVRLLREVKQASGGEGDEVAIARDIRLKLDAALYLFPARSEERTPDEPAPSSDWSVYLHQRDVRGHAAVWGTLLSWLFVHELGRVAMSEDAAQRSRSAIDEWLLGRIIASALQDAGLDEIAAWRAVTTVRILTDHLDWFADLSPEAGFAYRVVSDLLSDDEVRRFLQVNRHKDVLWFNKESFEQ
ncbi:MAG TPA: alpha-amylase family glycosyl hydrolase, partial [Anaerolineae bacterium]|nr:alpha-amylase family glycosyl hydrolase [Anaerolineae bacterium]